MFDFFGPGTTHAFVHPFASTEVPGLHIVTPELNLNTCLMITVSSSLQPQHPDRDSSPAMI